MTYIVEYRSARNALNAVYTVSASSVLHLYSAFLSYHSTADLDNVSLEVDGDILLTLAPSVLATYKTRDSGGISLTFPKALKFPAGTVFNVRSSSTSTWAFAGITGMQESIL